MAGAIPDLPLDMRKVYLRLKRWRSTREVARSLAAHQLQVLLAAGDPTATQAAPASGPEMAGTDRHALLYAAPVPEGLSEALPYRN